MKTRIILFSQKIKISRVKLKITTLVSCLPQFRTCYTRQQRLLPLYKNFVTVLAKLKVSFIWILYIFLQKNKYTYIERSLKFFFPTFSPSLFFMLLFSRKYQYLLNKQKSLKINEGTRFVNNQCTFLKYIYIFFFSYYFLRGKQRIQRFKGF